MDYNNTKPIYDLSFDSTIVKFFLAASENISEKGSEKTVEETVEKIISRMRLDPGITMKELEKLLIINIIKYPLMEII